MSDGVFDNLTVNLLSKLMGNVGIGTMSPQFGRLMIEDGAVPLAFRETGMAVDQGGLWRMPLDAGTLRFDVNIGASGSEFGENYRTLLAMTKEGNVGIGTADPLDPLQVNANANGFLISSPFNIRETIRFKETGNTNQAIIFDTGATGANSLRGFVIGYQSQNFAISRFNSSGSAVPTDDLYIGASGNIGIGTTSPPSEKLEVNGNIKVSGGGDVQLVGGDCAEEFDVVDAKSVEPGTVMVIDKDGALQPSDHTYDKRVAGVISGAGDLRPGITLDKQSKRANRLPLALVGKAYCKVDAELSSIELGDLLTTSSTIGHAMKASDPFKAFGSVIGKALRPMETGRGIIPILIALQ